MEKKEKMQSGWFGLGKTVTCKDQRLKKFICQWLDEEGWKFNDFSEILKSANIQMPVEVYDLDEKLNSFRCVSEHGRERIVRLFFGEMFDTDAQISIAENGENWYYNLKTKMKLGEIPKLVLSSIAVQRSDRELINYYNDTCCLRVIKFNNGHIVKVNIDECYNCENDIKGIARCSVSKIEEYLLNIEFSEVSAKKICDEITGFLELSADEMERLYVTVTHNEITGNGDERLIEKVTAKAGLFQEYYICDKSESCHIFDSGNWKYCKGKSKLSFDKEKNEYSFSEVGLAESIILNNVQDFFSIAKEKTSILLELFNVK